MVIQLRSDDEVNYKIMRVFGLIALLNNIIVIYLNVIWSGQDVSSIVPELQTDPLLSSHRGDKKSIELIILYATNHVNYDNLINGDSMKNNWFASEKDTSVWEDDNTVCSQTGVTGPAPYPTLKQVNINYVTKKHRLW